MSKFDDAFYPAQILTFPCVNINVKIVFEDQIVPASLKYNPYEGLNKSTPYIHNLLFKFEDFFQT